MVLDPRIYGCPDYPYPNALPPNLVGGQPAYAGGMYGEGRGPLTAVPLIIGKSRYMAPYTVPRPR